MTSDTTKLKYVYDPMCSWCWGYRPAWIALKQLIAENGNDIDIEYCLGGLAADSDVPMPDEMQGFLSQTWHKIAAQLGTEFNHDFWQVCRPRRSTYPACRACIVARDYGLEQQMILAIQTAYYLEAKNPSDIDTLVEAAVSIGIESAAFSKAIMSDEVNQRLMVELTAVHQLPIRGFPSLVLEYKGRNYPIALDYREAQVTFNEIKALMA
ncbi:DSBA-like thioredoxin domain protein [Shewanella sp. P1-14-1]|uniref:DsbA family protein n=1 Tax=Shewanella sp. P1-14-1 TaxID=1723761 RepID=UPI0006D6629B|nr:DsbA family protein [Shewanella sp. P1-14-1]KPZ68782.1 DSBA-like thioredoxin domain protein [Shewanella sp. P1-14-1]